jgi:uncharacterized protein (TIGR02996 family)
MLVIEVREPGQPARTRSFTRHTLNLGRELPQLTIADDVPLAGAIQTRHVELFECDGLLRVHAYAPTHLDGEPIPRRQSRTGESDEGRVVKRGSTLDLAGAATITVLEFTPIVPADFEVSEAEFLRAIKDEPSSIGEWLVYADALEEHDYLIRAEYLRLEVRRVLDQRLEGDYGAGQRYLKNLKAASRWLAAVRAPKVLWDKQCPAKLDAEACPIAWESESDVRVALCPRCQHAVRYPPK